ncbi:putative Ccc1 family protein [Rosa chinensis]|uniref:Vacuolar iron transporter n=1 Tax=Rosa chinensis TaxID=74649 RepID=A0A2P6PS36_ROSCH|nr:vacuolar iron transporter homolog 2 [Rosa chinensis]PRQ24743.1 putative Ccc1 family protein [Rosa chinensis]
MAPNSQASVNGAKYPNPTMNNLDLEHQPTQDLNTSKDNDDFDYSKRSQWLRAAVLGANDGLISTASLMMGVGAVKQDIKAMILTGFAGLVAGACSMAIGEFVSVYSQLDIEVAQMKRDNKNNKQNSPVVHVVGDEEGEEKENLPNPLQAAAASALAFSVGAMVPLLAASFIREYGARLGAVAAAVTLALMVFGWLGAALGKAPVLRSTIRVLVGGWMAMAITFGLTKLIGSSGL